MQKVRFSWPLRIFTIFLCITFVVCILFLYHYNCSNWRIVLTKKVVITFESLNEINVNRSSEPLEFVADDTLKIEALVDTTRYGIEIKNPPFPKKLFLGELKTGTVITGWYQIIFGPDSISNPYIGYTRFDLDFPPVIKKLPRQVCVNPQYNSAFGDLYFGVNLNYGKQIKPV